MATEPVARIGESPSTDGEVERAGGVDVCIVGGGPAGSVLACLLAKEGLRVVVVERDIHPREHVGESLTFSVNAILDRIGFLPKMEDAGFVHKPGAAWTAPRSPVGKSIALRLDELAPDGPGPQYAYNVERGDFDALLLRHAHECGAIVLEGVRAERVLFDGGRAVGVRARVLDGWERDIPARVVVDASGRRCLLAGQLGLRRKDARFDQLGTYSWFRGVPPTPAGTEGMVFLHFLGLERAWAWQIPLRHGLWSVGVVTDKADFRRAGVGVEEHIASLVSRNLNLSHSLRSAERIRPWSVEGDYSYAADEVAGRGWLLIGDALRFIDPVFSSGVDVAAYSALHAFEAIRASFGDGRSPGATEDSAFAGYTRTVTEGVATWYELISLFYATQNLFTYFAVRRSTRESVLRTLQGNFYQPETLARARLLIGAMRESHARIMADPANLLRTGAMASTPLPAG